jgi:plastocyanin
MYRHPAGTFALLALLAAAAAAPGWAQQAPAPAKAAQNSGAPVPASPAYSAPASQAGMSPMLVDEAATPSPATSPASVAPKPRKQAARSVAPDKPASTLSIRGTLVLAAADKQTVDAGEVADGLVYFLPKAGNPKPKPGYFTVNTHSKGFSPAVLVVPAGSTVSFPNRDTVLHSVFSRTPGTTFDFGNYGPGQSRQQVFTKPGLVIVNCSVHHSMRASVVVMATPYYVRPDRNGRFELSGLPPGAGTLVYWHPRAAAATVPLSLPIAAAQNQRLVATKPRHDHAGAR